jgi:hypothetical protein
MNSDIAAMQTCETWRTKENKLQDYCKHTSASSKFSIFDCRLFLYDFFCSSSGTIPESSTLQKHF